MLRRVDADLFKNNWLRCREMSSSILFSRVFTAVRLLLRCFADTKRTRQRKKPYNAFFASLVVVADYSIKTTACRADLTRCCALLPDFITHNAKSVLRFSRLAEISGAGDFLPHTTIHS